MRSVQRAVVAAAMLIGAASPQVMAQPFPNGPVKMLVGFAAGGSTDIIARDLGQELEKAWGQPVIIENRSGANGAIAAGQLAKLPADGQTLMMIVSGHVTNGHLNPRQPFDAIKDFTPISLIASSPLLIFAHPSFPGGDVAAMLAQAKAKPASISYASPGTGSIQHLSMELLSYLAGVKFVHVPYRSGALALNDNLAGHVPLGVLSVLQALPHLQAKSIKPLAVTSAKATDILPDVPALAEAGLKDYEAELWYVVIGPAGMPPALAAKMNADITRIVKSDGMRKRLEAQGARPVGSTQAEVAAFLQSESDKWGKVIKEAGIKGE